MDRCMAMSRDFQIKVGLDDNNFKAAALAKIDKDTGIVHFFPAKQISKIFTTYVKQSERFNYSESEIIDIVKKYTTHDSWYCTKINLLLAADSIDLKDHKEYITKLIWCIKKLAKIHPITETKCYRGYDCSKEEFDSYKLEENLFIPSFLSSSKNPKKFYQASNHNTLMVINLLYRPNNAFVVNEKYSIYSEQEEEVLFSCYSKFRVKKKSTHYKFNNKSYEFYIEMEHINSPEEMDDNIKNMVCANLFFI